MSSLPPDPYKALGVSKDAQIAEIRSAHRKLDPKQKEEKQREFQQVQQAYELLIRLEELKRDRGMTSTSTSSPRTSRRHETKYYDVREAEPRPTTFGSPPSHNVYGHTPPSRSWDENLYDRRFDEKPRYARKTASYEYDRERTRKDEDRRRRDEEKEWTRQQDRAREKEREERLREREVMKEREREREREAAKKEKDRRKDERKEDKKKVEKDRRKESDDKHRRDEPEEAVYTTSSSSKPDKKKSSSSKKYDETPAPAPPPPREASHPLSTTDRERKNSEVLDNAIRYLNRSGGKPPPLNRAQTFHADFAGVRHVAPIAVPTPPPAATAVFSPPPMADPRDTPLDGDVKRSSARPRRMSHDTVRSSKEKSHKKSSSSKEAIIVDAAPTSGARIVPSLSKSHSIPISGQSESHRMPHLSRSSTENYTRPQPPSLERAATWMPDSDLGRERSRSRHTRMYTDESSEDDRERERRQHRRSRRTQSPEDIPEDGPVHTTRYTVGSNKKVIPVQDAYFAEDSPRSSKKTSYAMPNSSARRAEPRQPYYEEDSTEYFPAGVKYSKTFNPGEIQFSNLPHSVREEILI
ncbi:DnaJ-domain-containing protein [Annulohypoxylon bovei var. microspora]|nr:DnaJ-domain-containing protein [Annulohypoxylon bovei var. microspora]